MWVAGPGPWAHGERKAASRGEKDLYGGEIMVGGVGGGRRRKAENGERRGTWMKGTVKHSGCND